MSLALMVIDLQKAYYDASSQEEMDKACGYINAAISLFRTHQLPVIWVYNRNDSKNIVPGEQGFEMIDLLKPDLHDLVIHKTYGNAFNRTNAQEMLKERGIKHLVMTGFSAENCVLSTYRGALDLDLKPMLLKGGLASRSPKNREFVEAISDHLTLGVLEQVVGFHCK